MSSNGIFDRIGQHENAQNAMKNSWEFQIKLLHFVWLSYARIIIIHTYTQSAPMCVNYENNDNLISTNLTEENVKNDQKVLRIILCMLYCLNDSNFIY